MDPTGFRPDTGDETPRLTRIPARPNQQERAKQLAAKYGPIAVAVLSVVVIGFAILWPSKAKAKEEPKVKEKDTTLNASAPVHVHNYFGKEPKEPKEEKQPEKKEEKPAETAKDEKDPPAKKDADE